MPRRPLGVRLYNDHARDAGPRDSGERSYGSRSGVWRAYGRSGTIRGTVVEPYGCSDRISRLTASAPVSGTRRTGGRANCLRSRRTRKLMPTLRRGSADGRYGGDADAADVLAEPPSIAVCDDVSSPRAHICAHRAHTRESVASFLCWTRG